MLEVGDKHVNLRLSAAHKHLMATPTSPAKLQDALSQALGRTLKLHIEVGEVSSQTPAQRNAEVQRQRHAEAVAALESDPFVQEMIERFDATLVESTVKPIQE